MAQCIDVCVLAMSIMHKMFDCYQCFANSKVIDM